MAAFAPASPRTGLLFRAIPDTGRIEASIGALGVPRLHLPNMTVLPDRTVLALERVANTVWYHPASPVTHQNVRWIVNLCADADEYRGALLSLDKAFGETAPIVNHPYAAPFFNHPSAVAIFNHPSAVAMSRRDLMAERLRGIDHLVVPRCVRFCADSPDSFAATFAEHGFTYPVLVRPAASQTGQGLHRIEGERDWPRLHLSNGYGKWHFMTQFHDTRTATGRFCKVRASFVGGTWGIRAFREDTDWLITGSVGALSSEMRESMTRNIDRLKADEAFNAMLDQIGARVPLDFFGIDIGVADDCFVFFEANAAMTMARASTPGLQNDPMMRAIYLSLEKKLVEHLAKPEQWRATRHTLPRVRDILV